MQPQPRSHRKAIEARFETALVAAFNYNDQGAISSLGSHRPARYILELARTSERKNLAELTDIRSLLAAAESCIAHRSAKSLKPPSET